MSTPHANDPQPSSTQSWQPTAPEAETLPPSPAPQPETLPPVVDANNAATVPPEPRQAAAHDVAAVPGYEILRELGRGGMGVVYLARQVGLNRLVALKMILSGGHAGSADLERFRTEGEAIARLQHPNIVQIYEVGEHDGLPFFSLEFCAGGSLAEKLRENPLPPRQAAELVALLADAMQAAHAQGIIHRDLKPANVLLTGGGRVEASGGREPPEGSAPSGGSRPPLANSALGAPKITDFGLAKKLDEAGQTHSGAIMGTPSYMAPEQAGGQTKLVGPLADVYALGAILYDCLTGRPPFRAATAMDTVLQVLRSEPVPPSQLNAGVPRDVETICLKCLRKEPAQRYASAAELAQDLRHFLAGEPIQARPVGRLERGVKWVKRNPVVATLLTTVAAVLLLGAGISTWFGITADYERGVAQQALHNEEQARKDRALAQVGALRDAAPGAVPGILKDLEANRAEVLPRLRELYAAEATRSKRLRLALALLPVEPEKVRDELVTGMLQADEPAEVLLVRDALKPHAAALAPGLWQQANATMSPAARFRALVALASFDPDNPRWQQAAADAGDQLLTANALHLGAWVQALQPVRGRLLAPLSAVFRGERLADHKQVAAQVLAGYAADRPDVLAELLLDADARQFGLLAPKLQEQGQRGTTVLLAEVDRQLDAAALDADRERLAQRQANAAVALLQLQHPDQVWPLLRHRPDPTLRSSLVQRAKLLGVEPRLLVQRLQQEEKDDSARRALIVALGEYTDQELPLAVRAPLVKQLLVWYRDDPDAGIHGAIDWLLRHSQEGPAPRPLDWGQRQELEKIDRELASQWREPAVKEAGAAVGPASRAGPATTQWSPVRLGSADLPGTEVGDECAVNQGCQPPEEKSPRRWYINGQGQTVSLIKGPVEFRMGSPLTEPKRRSIETPHMRVIPRTFAIAAKSITVSQWQAFRKERPGPTVADVKEYSPVPECPIIGVTFYEAMQYCNWLSEKEGIPPNQWCYPEKIAEGMKPHPDYLQRTGYRLPSEAEWEFACRSGTVTARYYGAGNELLPRYAWYMNNAQERSWPVGQKRPNDLGLFDMHGNVWNWCQNRNLTYPSDRGEDKEDLADINEKSSRVLRGASFFNNAPYVRTANRYGNRPASRLISNGLRIARTSIYN